MTPEQMIEGYKSATLQSEKDRFANDLMCLIIKTPICKKWKFTINELPDEIWVSVKDFEDYYQISNYGRLKRLEWERDYDNRRSAINTKVKYKEKICEYKQGHPRYARTILISPNLTRRVNIHVLVAEHFIPNYLNLPEVNHKDGVKRNNHYLNLEWSTHLDNVRHALLTGLKKGRIIDSAKAVEIFNCDKTSVEIATIFNIPINTVYDIKSGRRWSLFTGKVREPKRKK